MFEGCVVEKTHPRLLLGVAQGLPVSVKWLRRGLACFLWASGRKLASLHQSAAAFLFGEPEVRLPVTDGAHLQVAGSFVQYLFERYGMNRLHRFFMRAEKVGIESASRTAFGKGFVELGLGWESMLASLIE